MRLRSTPGLREQTLLLCLMIAAAQMTWGSIVPVLPLYLERYGLAVGALGPILAAFAVGRALVNTPAGLALRWLQPRRYLWAVAACLVVVTALTGLATTTTSIMAMRFIAGVFGGAVVTIAFSVLVTAAPADRRGATVAMSMMAMTGAVAAGALLGAVVVELFGLRASFVAAAGPLVIVLAWEALRPAARFWDAYRPPAPQPHVQASGSAPPEPAGPADPVGSRRRLLGALCGVSFATFFVRFAGEQGLVPVMAYDGADMRPLTLSAAIAVGTVASLALAPVLGRVVDRGVRRPVLVLSGVAAAAGVAALPLLAEAWLFSLALVVYFAATTSLNVVPSVIAGERWGPAESGAVIGLTRTVGDIGAAAGPLVIFWLVEQTSWLAACLLMAGLLVGTVLHLARVAPRDVVREVREHAEPRDH
ncbi:MFS transporter [Aeromicrobium sp. S22]|uniref:MFS transporter n=1 Tax=Aeromicrobium sp. S22 TaxID=2662029 RepID=UPI00129DE080|nr:MFS transporter [Aeromicrobium sp. S22]MRK02241.1 MFS transporter [Aeromicrobium sp. S22]